MHEVARLGAVGILAVSGVFIVLDPTCFYIESGPGADLCANLLIGPSDLFYVITFKYVSYTLPFMFTSYILYFHMTSETADCCFLCFDALWNSFYSMMNFCVLETITL